MRFVGRAALPAPGLAGAKAGLKFRDLETIHKGVQLHAPSQPRSGSADNLRPLLKWAGGKRQLLAALGRHYPQRFERYIEAFVGSGAVFFDLLRAGVLTDRRARLADVNPDLIGCYQTLRDRTEEVIDALRILEREHRKRGDACYYQVRDERFNPQRAANSGTYTPELAAMLIFLNRTGFNGLFRLNRRGEFNVPAGRYSDPRICDADHLRRVAAAFRSKGVSLELSPFETTLGEAGSGDFVYCDPPYVPLSRTSSFAHYTAGGFGPQDQQRLRDAVVAACRRGAHVMLSNSSAAEVVEMYSTPPARAAGLVLHRVPARRAINSRASLRGPVDELIVTNVEDRLKNITPRMLRSRVQPKRRTA